MQSAPSMTSQKNSDHPKINLGKIGVLLINLGTPDGYDKKSVRRYLSEFLSDRRVIELTPLLWQPILQGIILNTRPAKSAEAYEKVWFKDSNESPLRFYIRSQAKKLADKLSDKNNELIVDWAMRYGNPSIEEKLLGLKEQGCERIVIFSLYPQYSATTTASVNDKVFDILKELRWQPALRTVPPYFETPAYIEALGKSIETYLDECEQRPDLILASYHGLPLENLHKGDPYYCHCAKTNRLLREHLDMSEDFLQMSFQSRFGPKKWLEPYTVTRLEELAKEGKRVAVIMPGFAADCLETLEEMNMQNREVYLQNGGQQYDFIPCLNDSDVSIAMLEAIISNELQGWLS